MPRDTLHIRLAHPDPWTVAAQSRTERGHVFAAAAAITLARLRQSRTPRAAVAWLVARLGVALFLLATAGRVGHAGLLGRIAGQ